MTDRDYEQWPIGMRRTTPEEAERLRKYRETGVWGDATDSLRTLATKCHSLEAQLESCRRERDRVALALVADGHTWREVADAAGFANPYIATLKRRQRAEQP